MFYTRISNGYKVVPKQIRTMAIATSIRWFGWGLCEALIPTLYYQTTGNFIGAGLIASISAVIYLVFFIPTGILFDRLSMRRVLMLGLWLFVFSSLGFFVVSHHSYLPLIILTEIFCGFSVIIDVVGRSAYIRTHASKEHVASSYGFSDSLINAGTISGVVVAILLAGFVNPYYLFLAVPPTTFITWFMFWKYLPDDSPPASQAASNIVKKIKGYFQTAVLGVKQLNRGLIVLLFLLLFSTALFSVGLFYLPINFFVKAAGPQAIFLAFGVSTLPLVFSAYLGLLADRREYQTLMLGLGCAAITLAVLAFIFSEVGQLIAVFILTLSTVLLNLSVEALITSQTPATQYGLISSFVEAMKSIGPLIGPLVIGFSIGVLGASPSFLLFSGITIVVIIAVALSKYFLIAGLRKPAFDQT